MACWVIFVFTFCSGLNAAEVSRDARRHMIRGQVEMEEARTESGYQNAIAEFKKAIQYAPEWADAWYNLGVAQESATYYSDAIKSFNKYLDLNPNAADSIYVEDKVIRLEYKREKQQEKQEEEARVKRRAREARLREERERNETALSIGGTWFLYQLGVPRRHYMIKVNGKNFNITLVARRYRSTGNKWVRVSKGVMIKGTIEDGEISGYHYFEESNANIKADGGTCFQPAGWFPLIDISLSSDGYTMKIRFIHPSTNCSSPVEALKLEREY